MTHVAPSLVNQYGEEEGEHYRCPPVEVADSAGALSSATSTCSDSGDYSHLAGMTAHAL
jgi:hypothetical protein